MSIAPVKRSRSRGFTLLEIALATAILGMMSLAIYRFVAANLTVLRVSSQEDASAARYTGFIRLISAQLQDLPGGAGALTGEPYKFNDASRDEMTWICRTGPGLVTRYAPGEFLVSMRLKPAADKSEKSDKGEQMEIGFMRKPRDTAEGSEDGQSWVPLLDDVRSLQIRYFDSRLNVWVERWTDTVTLPPLVKLVIARGGHPPQEAVIAIRRTPLQIVQQVQLPQPVQPGVPLPGQGLQPGQQPPQATPPTPPKSGKGK
jgi:prepilin-type N-terminal cleavage/methylation domain-containing protein